MELVAIYIVIGIILTSAGGYIFGARTTWVDTLLDIVLWPFLLYYVIKY